MKECFKKSWNYFKIKMNNILYNQHFWIIIVIIFIVIFEYTKDIRIMIKMTGVPITPYFITFFLSDYVVASGVMKILILLGFVAVICNVSKMYQEKYYFIIRTGYKAGVFGDALFIGAVSVIYAAIIYLFSIICFLPNLEFQLGWGKIISTLAYTDASVQYASVFVINSRIIDIYNPVEATLLSFTLLVLGCWMLGMLVYVVNVISNNKALGIAIACILILISPIVIYYRIPALYWVSPMTWVSIGCLTPVLDSDYPSVFYAAGMFMLMLTVILIILNKHTARMEIKGDYHG
ncbi:hypothetical protein [Faecalicatena orotica]|uniref:hypothetical protein n=1 Tax=Faecalicatena orotica TaxID=1544 RepID=UPI00321620EA